ncbi:MAG TPA: lmo0937 family membrane protein [Gemmatimonadota bacterium]
MDVLSERIALAALLAAWGLGAAFEPLGGMIHILLVAAIIVFLAGRFGRRL